MWVRVSDATHWEGERPMCHNSGSVLRCAVLLLSERGDIPHQLRLAPTSSQTVYRWRTSHLHTHIAERNIVTHCTYGPFFFSQEPTV